MISFTIGAALLAASIAALWYFRSRNGVPASFVTLPLMGTLIALCVTSGLALGVALIIAGALG